MCTTYFILNNHMYSERKIYRYKKNVFINDKITINYNLKINVVSFVYNK